MPLVKYIGHGTYKDVYGDKLCDKHFEYTSGNNELIDEKSLSNALECISKM